MRQAASTFPDDARQSFWRTLVTFDVTRIVIAVVLFIYLIVNVNKAAWESDQLVYWSTCLTYLMLAIGFTLISVYFRHRFFLQLLSQITVDLTVISILYFMGGGTKSGLAILYLFPLAGVAILAPLLLALFLVSVVTIFMLGESAYRIWFYSGEMTYSQAGLYGAAFFAAIYVVNRLAARLIKQEELAAQRGRELRMQEAINSLVIADMSDGVLVIGRNSEILTANPAAEQMLGISFPHEKPRLKISSLPSLAPIAQAFANWRARRPDPSMSRMDQASFVVVKRGENMSSQESVTVWGGRRELTTHLKLRFVMVDETASAQGRTVAFLQDVTEIENQAQQLKLASMGRLTASIAHEVRNPLSAISYAASLLAEDGPNPSQARLLNIIADNVARMNRMIEDILKLSRKAQQHGEPILLMPLLTEILDEFRERQALPEGMVEVIVSEGSKVSFDPLHLREVLVNLLSNALRYASGRPASIRILVVRGGLKRLELHVQDDGPPITPEVRSHLFEPFYTTSSKGTGLGLYLARELCLNNDAKLDYEYRAAPSEHGPEPASGRFVISFAVADLPSSH